MGHPYPVFFNAHHSPCGAFASFTLGARGPKGGFGLELAGPANERVYIGFEDRDTPNRYHALPFYAEEGESFEPNQDYDVEGLSGFHRRPATFEIPEASIVRDFGACVDTWRTGDLTFRLISDAPTMSDPNDVDALTPAVIAELTFDNRAGTRARKAFFGFEGSDRAAGMRHLDEPDLVGIANGMTVAIATLDRSVTSGIGFQPEAVLEPRRESNREAMLGPVGLTMIEVPAGEVKTVRYALCFFREGAATSGIRTRYLYRRWFERVEDVARRALASAEARIARAAAIDERLVQVLSPVRGAMAAHAIRSYYGSTQALETDSGDPLWVVNEGEYRMMNTFDLAVDQCFYELALHPWTVRNELDLFVDRYSYDDQVRRPGEDATHAGGIAFCHDMGVANAFAKPGRSSYELAGLTGCFSFMSGEELMNWVLMACVYVKSTGDLAWANERRSVFADCLHSLLNRDDPNPDLRNGVMGADGARCEGGSEITTYDSLDASLGQARNNVYLAVKGWAAYVLLEPRLRELGYEQLALEAKEQARRCAATVVASADCCGRLPAVLDEGVESRIIPAIEGLVYPWIVGDHDAVSRDGRFGELVRTLERHFELVLRPGVCRFEDGGWKLSSSSGNSWLSKIYLCQFIAERIFGRHRDAEADVAHLGWLMSPVNGYYAWSDQMLDGRAVGSRYYPRGVTSALWLAAPGEDPIAAIRRTLS